MSYYTNYTNTFSDHLENQIIVNWNEKLWNKHLSKHPELTDFQTTNNLINTALSKPSIVMHCSGHANTKHEEIYCYYYEVKRHQQLITYIKVVVGCNSQPPYVKSVWQKQALNYLVVQERKYNYFTEVWKSPSSYL